MDSLEALAPLLGTRKQQDASDDRQHKRHKPTSTEATGVTQRELAMTQVIKAMANLLLNHDRSLQNLHKQDSFVIFARAHLIGMMPIMAVLAKDWKEKMPQNRENPQWLTLRTHLLKGLMQELLTRVVQISESQVGNQLWDTAVAKKTILPDGAWVYQKWSPSEQQLVQAQRAPMPMAQMVKTLKTEDADRCLAGQHACPSIPQPEDTTGHHALDPAADDERLRALGHLQRADGQLGVGAPCHEPETTPTEPIQTSPGPLGVGGQRQRQIDQGSGQGEATSQDHVQCLLSTTGDILTREQRQQLRQTMTGLALANPNTLCYANSAVLCYLWTSMSRRNFQLADWGQHSATLMQFLHNTTDAPISLDSLVWFDQVISGWDQAADQADSAEFTHRLLNWIGTDIVSNKWERRVIHRTKTELHDQGDAHMPITLLLDLDMIADNDVSLANLVRLWHGDLGMSTGLTAPSDIVILHIDRLVHDHNGQVQKLHTSVRFRWTIHLPILLQDTQVRWEPYQLVAAFAHLGGAHGGHYQALLKTFPETSDIACPSMWLFCDDNRTPTRCWSIPPQFEEGVTCMWLC